VLKSGDVGCGEAVVKERGVRMGFWVCSGEDMVVVLGGDDLGVVLMGSIIDDG
jgi:hypothetical protein